MLALGFALQRRTDGPESGAARAHRLVVRALARGNLAAVSSRKIRVVVAKPGLDGHDRGAKIIVARCATPAWR